MDKIILSIIIPIYNGSKYIGECIEHIKKQTLKSIEVIIIDDGSIDSTMEVLKDIKKANSFVRIFEQEHKGSGAARNLGIKKALGKYIAFCDSDDYYYDFDALEKMVGACEKNDIKVCAGYRVDLREDEIRENFHLKDIIVNNKDGAMVSFEELQNDYFYHSFIFERKMILENGFCFPDYLRYQDPPFLVKVLDYVKKFWVMPVCVYCYREWHQDKRNIERKIKYVLMGIRDNLKTASENGYERLYNLLIDERLDGDFYQGILKGCDEREVRETLEEIKQINEKSPYKKKIKAIEDMEEYKKIEYIFNDKTAYFEISNEWKLFNIYRKLSIMQSKKIDLGHILELMGLREIYIYGVGEIGKIFISFIEGKANILDIFDGNFNREIKSDERSEKSYKVKNPMEIPDDDKPIIVTPALAFFSISEYLIKNGIKRTRIYSLYSILEIAMKYASCRGNIDKLKIESKKQFLITGAQFKNKGAESMLFTAVSEIRERFKDALIWYLPIDEGYTEEVMAKYNFIFLTERGEKDIQLLEILPNLTAIIDVSGYALSSYWKRESERYLKILRMAYAYEVPLYIMPQSFGPFEYAEERQKEIKKLLAYAKVVYAREKSTLDIMKQTYGLKNLQFSNDLVLQNKSLNFDNIYIRKDDVKRIKLDTRANVAIIPNFRNYEFGNKESILKMYKVIIDKLLSLGKNVYIFNHSGDGVVCKDIYEMFGKKVNLFAESLDCVEYSLFIQNFDYIIASRYHSIVHALKEKIPCVAIGWEQKYKDLFEIFKQGDYCFDVRDELKEDKLIGAIERMDSNYKNEKEKIRDILILEQKNNCFDILNSLY